MIIKSRAPLRLGLAGGGTDVSPYCDTYGGLILNATIDKYAYAMIKLLDEPVLRFVAADQEKEIEFHLVNKAVKDVGILSLHLQVYLEMIKRYNGNHNLAIELTTYCDAPQGSGLGSSSTIVVAMIKAFLEYFRIEMDSYEIAQLAFQIERMNCGLQGGRQDQYSATFGGLNFMEFYAGNKVIVNSLRINDWIFSELESMLLLYYTGVSRESANIINDQKENVEHNKLEAIEAMHGIKNEAIKMKEGILRGDIQGIIDSMKQGWENKKKSARTVTTPAMETIYDAAIENGALAGKISGAGGGGFFMFLVPPKKKMRVIKALECFGGFSNSCHFTMNGASSWKIR